MATTKKLRDQMLDDLTAFRKGKLTQAKAEVIANLTSNILDTMKIETDAARAGSARRVVEL